MIRSKSAVLSWLVAASLLLGLAVSAEAQSDGGNMLGEKEKKEIIDALAEKFNDEYVFPDVAKEMEKALKKNMKSGGYDDFDTPRDFARALTDDLREVSKDLHVSVLHIDAEEMKPLIGNITGGLSGPAIKPLALKAVYDVSNKVKIPVIGIGGIMTGIDAAEFMLCGATAVQIGTALFVDPRTPLNINEGLKKYLKSKKLGSVRELIGKVRKY